MLQKYATNIILIMVVLIFILNIEKNVNGQCAQPSFGVAPVYPAGAEPRTVANGDFNRDGINDLIVLNQFSTASLLLGNANGSFQSPQTINLPGQHISSAVGDFNNDNKLDFLTTGNLILGNGDGTFGSPIQVSVANAFAVGEINNDGKLDIVFYTGNGISVILGNGDGTFTSPTFVNHFAVNITAIGIADINGDNKAEVITANTPFSNDPRNISVFLGTGTATLGTRTEYAIGASPLGLVIGDLNNDNKPDVVTGNGANISVLINNGSGGFNPFVNYTTPNSNNTSRYITTGDFNNDNFLDLVVVSNSFAGSDRGVVLVFQNNGNGTFNTPAIYQTGYGPTWAITKDYNNDGKLDVAVLNYGNNQTGAITGVGLLFGKGDGGFVGVTAFYPGSGKLVKGDFNNDNKLDLAVYYNNSPTRLAIRLGDGLGSFGPPIDFDSALPGFVNKLYAADLNRDGNQDIVATTQSQHLVLVYLGNGNATFGARTSYTAGDNPYTAAIADYNRDGFPDIAAVNSGTTHTISIFFGNGNGSFSQATNIPTTVFASQIVTDDFNRDGIADLIISGTNSGIGILLGNGSGGFSGPTFFPIGTSPQELAVGDFNKDGIKDLAINTAGKVAVLYGVGNGTFNGLATYTIGSSSFDIAVTDFNSDGYLDIAVPNFTLPSVTILPGTSNGTFGTALAFYTVGTPYEIQIGDFNGDRSPDIVMNESLAFYFSLLTNTCPAPLKSPFDFDGDGKSDFSIFRPSGGEWWYQQSSDNNAKAFTFGTNTDKIVPADYDGDGKTDVAFFRPSTGEWFVLRSSNLTFFAAPFGASGDMPAPADFDGDSKADLALFRPSQATWYILKSTGGVQITPFGANGDVPQVADYDGDGKADIGIYRPAGGSGVGEWWILRSTAGLFATPFGSATDKPVAGDYTGDGKADVAFFRPTTSEWYVLRSENLAYFAAPFGAAGDIPSAGDYDGDGKTDLAVFRPSSATWFVLKSGGGILIQQFGATGDIPVPAAFVP